MRCVPAIVASAGAFLISGVIAAQCCSVPVFRYALDHWPADSFRLEVPVEIYQDDALAPALRNLGQNAAPNLEASRSRDTASTARLLTPPKRHSEGLLLWNGKLDSHVYNELTNSPARQELAKRLLEGCSMVWVIVECGKSEADNATVSLVEKRLRFLEQVCEIAPMDPSDPSNKLGPGPKLEIKLSAIRITRDSPEERLFITMLAGPSGLSALPDDKPFVAAVFGRGRVLGVWSDPDESTIEEASRFLMGACSCQVKNQNPGWDLLMPVDWDSALRKADELRLASLSKQNEGSSASKPIEPETVVITPQSTAPQGTNSLTARSPILLLPVVSIVALMFVLSVRRRKP